MNRMPAAVEMDVAEGAEAEGARRATGAAGSFGHVARRRTPTLKCRRRSERRRFTAEYRLRILKQADACKKPGDAGRAVASRRLVQLAADELAAPARAGRARQHAGARASAGRRRGRSIRA